MLIIQKHKDDHNHVCNSVSALVTHILSTELYALGVVLRELLARKSGLECCDWLAPLPRVTCGGTTPLQRVLQPLQVAQLTLAPLRLVVVLQHRRGLLIHSSVNRERTLQSSHYNAHTALHTHLTYHTSRHTPLVKHLTSHTSRQTPHVKHLTLTSHA